MYFANAMQTELLMLKHSVKKNNEKDDENDNVSDSDEKNVT